MSLQIFPVVLSFALIISANPLQPARGNEVELVPTSKVSIPSIASNAATLPFNASSSNGFTIKCDGETYGYNPNIRDCENAKEYLIPDATIWTFGQRHTGLPENSVPLPFEVIGDRGLCYFQPVLIGDHETALASIFMLRRAAAALILQCAAVAVSQGGIATNIGGDNNLAVIMGKFNLPVTCRGNLHDWNPCREVLYDMPADNVPQVFGPRSDPAVVQELPYHFTSSDMKCTANVFSTGRSDVSSFYEIWEASTAVFSVCGRHRKSGVAKGIGQHGGIFLSLTNRETLELPGNVSSGVSS